MQFLLHLPVNPTRKEKSERRFGSLHAPRFISAAIAFGARSPIKKALAQTLRSCKSTALNKD